MEHLYKQGKRKCYSCKTIFELNAINFRRNASSFLGLAYQCRVCARGGGIRRILIEAKKFTCEKCGLQKIGEYSFFDIDHIKPIHRRANGISENNYHRKSDIHNLMVLCPNCHRIKTITNREHIRG